MRTFKEATAIKRQRRVFIIESGRQCGLTAPKLEELKSLNGRPFIEIENKNYRKAVVISEDGKYPIEYAYFCRGSEQFGSCGWVKGEPRYGKDGCYCYICGVKIGERKK